MRVDAEKASALQEHITRAKASGREHSSTSLATVSEANAAKVLHHTGYSITGYKRLIQSSDIRHVFRSHGDPVIEAARGQVAIRKRDFMRLGVIIDSAHSIAAIGRPKAAKPLRLAYIAIVDDHEYHYVKEVRPNKVIALKSMRKQKKGGTRRE